jgi:hypothetical protein
MKKHHEIRSLIDAYRVRGFKTRARVEQAENEPMAFVLTLDRRQKKHAVENVEHRAAVTMTASGVAPAISIAVAAPSILILSCAAWLAMA